MQGIHDFTSAQYHADPAPAPSLSNSLIKTLLTQSPAHARLKHPRLNPAYESVSDDRFDLGSACHAMLLEGVDDVVVVDAEDWRTKAAKETRDEARAAGRLVLLRRHYEAAREMESIARSFLNRSGYASVLNAGKPEQTLLWEDGGIWCRARLDWLSDQGGVILDYKTTSAKNPEDFMRSSMVAFGYDTQDAFYRRGMKAITGKESEFVFFVQEDTAPFACYFVQTAQSMRELAAMKVERAITAWDNALAFDEWPAYGSGIYFAEAPVWALKEEYAR